MERTRRAVSSIRGRDNVTKQALEKVTSLFY